MTFLVVSAVYDRAQGVLDVLGLSRAAYPDAGAARASAKRLREGFLAEELECHDVPDGAAVATDYEDDTFALELPHVLATWAVVENPEKEN